MIEARSGSVRARESGQPSRSAIWVVGVFLVAAPLQLLSLWIASMALAGAGPAREWVIGGATLVWSFLTAASVLVLGSWLKSLRHVRIRPEDGLAFLLAPALAYAVALATRLAAGEGGFETEHAMPQLLIAYALVPVGAARLGVTASGATIPWRVALGAAWALLLFPTVLTAASIISGYTPPGALLALGAVATYAAVTVVSVFRRTAR